MKTDRSLNILNMQVFKKSEKYQYYCPHLPIFKSSATDCLSIAKVVNFKLAGRGQYNVVYPIVNISFHDYVKRKEIISRYWQLKITATQNRRKVNYTINDDFTQGNRF
jgi:hypothetical protein